MSISKKLSAKNRGFTLVELMIVVVIIGVLAALAIYGVQKYVANAKSAEARTSLGRISKDAAKSAMGETMPSALVAIGSSVAFARRLCGSATTVPNTLTALTTFPVATAVTAPAAIQGKKYQAAEADWSTGSENNGWTCLGTSMVGPQIYGYGYYSSVTHGTPATGLASGQSFSAYAVGDLDGDTVGSALWLQGDVATDASNNLTIRLAPSIGEYSVNE